MEQKWQDDIDKKSARKIKAQREKHRNIWFGLGMFGLVGWSVTVPTLVGVALGVWIDKKWPSQYSWTLMLMLIGIVLGCWNAWLWIKRESHYD